MDAAPTHGVTARLVAALPADFTGESLTPRHANYDAARQVWNGMIDRRPALIVRPRSTSDVVHAVQAARETGQPPAVRGGGHQVAGFAVCEGGLVIDLSLMRRVVVDVETRRAQVEGGCLLGDLDRATQKHGLVVPAGAISHTGVGGLTLGGGIGWLCRKYGLTCDHLVAAEVVLADGSVVVADQDHHRDLLWALRGGGGNFGVVTRFEFALRELHEVHFTQHVYGLSDASRVLREVRAAMPEAPDELMAVCALRRAPDLPIFPREVVGEPILALNLVWSGDVTTPNPLGNRLADLVRPIASRARVIPFLQLQTMQDDFHPHGLWTYMKSQYLQELPDEAIETLVQATKTTPGPHTQIELVHLLGQIPRVPARKAAYSNRDAPWIVNIVASWEGPETTDEHVTWARWHHEALAVAGAGTAYANFVDADTPASALYSDAVRTRLIEVKRRYDPTNLFRRNHNIGPGPS